MAVIRQDAVQPSSMKCNGWSLWRRRVRIWREMSLNAYDYVTFIPPCWLWKPMNKCSCCLLLTLEGLLPPMSPSCHLWASVFNIYTLCIYSGEETIPFSERKWRKRIKGLQITAAGGTRKKRKEKSRKGDMGRPPCCDKVGTKKGPWTPEEDIMLVSYIQEHGPGNWRFVPASTGKFLPYSWRSLSI